MNRTQNFLMEQAEAAEPAKRQVSFRLDFSKISELKVRALPQDADQLWKAICDPYEPITYTHLLRRIMDPKTDPKQILEAFGLAPRSHEILTTELRRHLRYLRRILPPSAFGGLSSQFVVDLQNLTDVLNDSTIFALARHLLWNCLARFQDSATLCDIMCKFAEFLVPESLQDEFQACRRPYLKYLFFLPVEAHTKPPLQWLALERDKNTLHVLLNGQMGMQDKTYRLDQMAVEFFDDEISFSSKSSADTQLMKFNFFSKQAMYVWKDAISATGDPLVYFVQCLPLCRGHLDGAPPEFFEAICGLLKQPDNDFAMTVAESAATLAQDGMPYIGALLSFLQRHDLLPYFMRQLFGEYLSKVVDSNMILKDNTATPLSCTMYLEASGKKYADLVAQRVMENTESFQQIIRTICSTAQEARPAIHFLLHTCFRAVRRRFPESKAPLTCLGNIIVMRLLLWNTSLRMLTNPPGFAQKLMAAFVLQSRGDDTLTESDFLAIADYFIDTSRPVPGICDYPTMEGDQHKIFAYCCESKDLSYLVTKRLERTRHPLTWSILEVLENAIFGEEDFHAMIKDCELVAHR